MYLVVLLNPSLGESTTVGDQDIILYKDKLYRTCLENLPRLVMKKSHAKIFVRSV